MTLKATSDVPVSESPQTSPEKVAEDMEEEEEGMEEEESAHSDAKEDQDYSVHAVFGSDCE